MHTREHVTVLGFCNFPFRKCGVRLLALDSAIKCGRRSPLKTFMIDKILMEVVQRKKKFSND
jgi:hypothetical protein